MRHAASIDPSLAWCNSRTEATRLYRKYGFTSSEAHVTPTRERVRMTCRLDRTVPVALGRRDEGEIARIDTYPRLSRIVVHNKVAYIGGLLPNRSDVSIARQTEEVLEKIDFLLERAGTHKSKLVSATVWIKNLDFIKEANAVWEAWLPEGTAPSRSCVEAVPGAREYGIEIAVIAAC